MDKIIEVLLNFNPLFILPIAIVTFIFLYNLVTVLTASVIESRLLTKEWRIVRTLYRKTMLFMTIIFLLGYLSIVGYYFLKAYYPLLVKSRYFSWISIVLTILIMIGYFYFRLFKRKLNPGLVEKAIKYTYIGSLTFYLVLFIGMNTIHSFFITINNDKNLSDSWLFSLLFVFFICSFIFYFFIKPVILKNANIQEIFITVDNEKWYLLHPLNKQEFLIGDNPSQEECNKIKILSWEDLKAFEINKSTSE